MKTTENHNRDLRANARQWLRGWGRPAWGDLVAGVTNALVYLPQGIGYGIVSGVNPVFGLYTGIFAPLIASLTASSIFMVVIATNELAVPTGQLAAATAGGLDAGRLAALTLLVGVFGVAAGVLGLGSAVRFISESVMTGFILGIMLTLILGQAANVTGFDGQVHGNDVTKIIDIAARPQAVSLAATAIGGVTIASVLLLQRTRLKQLAFLLPMIVLTGLVWVWKPAGVPLAGEAHIIPNGLPAFVWPDWGSLPDLLAPALSLTIIGLSFSAGVAQAFPNPGGLSGKPSQDFWAQGLANLGGAFFHCLPAAGSMSRTVYLVEAGARTRWANTITGLASILIVMTLASAAAHVPLSVVGGMLIVIGVNAIDPHKLRLVWAINWTERLTLAATAALTIFVSPSWAILVGVVFSLAVVLVQSAASVAVNELVRQADGRWLEQPAARQFSSGSVVALRVHGFLYFAGVETIETALAPALAARQLALILSLQQYTSLGSTNVAFLARFARAMRAGGNTLILADVAPGVLRELAATQVAAEIGVSNLFASDAGSASLERAWAAATATVGSHPPFPEGTAAS